MCVCVCASCGRDWKEEHRRRQNGSTYSLGGRYRRRMKAFEDGIPHLLIASHALGGQEEVFTGEGGRQDAPEEFGLPDDSKSAALVRALGLRDGRDVEGRSRLGVRHRNRHRHRHIPAPDDALLVVQALRLLGQHLSFSLPPSFSTRFPIADAALCDHLRSFLSLVCAVLLHLTASVSFTHTHMHAPSP